MGFLEDMIATASASALRAIKKAAVSVVEDAQKGLEAAKQDLAEQEPPRKVDVDIKVKEGKS